MAGTVPYRIRCLSVDIILPVILYGGETLSLTSREEIRPTLSENKVLKKILRLNREEVTGD
jgi:hypothetical protein